MNTKELSFSKKKTNEGFRVDAGLSTLAAIPFGQNMSRDTVIHLCL